MSEVLPVMAVMPDLLASLRAVPNAVLIAPPGAGKTTKVAPALLEEPYCSGQILLLSPRRLAARMAAERISENLGETVGGQVGYATRLDSKHGPDTRILVMTEGIFRNRIISDPELSGVSAVLFDEVHERSIDSDFGLALALEAQAAFRPDLRLLAMSATLDGSRFSTLMDNAPVLESEGKRWPLEYLYVGRRTELPIETDIVRILRQALSEQQGDILAFLPGVREIDRAFDALGDCGPDIVVHRLHGQIDPVDQRLAVRRDAKGRRKVIFATNIAETSLTIDGVCVVVDSGLARRARFDQAAGVTRLVTERASLSAATQRAGRAARQQAGVAYRMWEEAGNGGLPPFDPPEILESDLAPLLIDCARWGENDPAKLRWLDLPPAAAVQQARKLLMSVEALDAQGRITAHGTSLAKLPLPPNLAHMVLSAAHRGQAEDAAMLAVLLQERGLGGQSEDIDARYERFVGERGAKAEAARKLAQRIARLCSGKGGLAPLSIGGLIATAFPERIAKRRDAKGEKWISAMGRGLQLDAASPLASAEWLAVADLQGAASGARILSAAALTEAEIIGRFAHRITSQETLSYDKNADRVDARVQRRLGAIVLSEGHVEKPDSAAVASALLAAVQDMGIDILPWSASARTLRERALFAGIAAFSDEALAHSAQQWLLPLLGKVNRLRDVAQSGLAQALDNLLGWDARTRIDQIAPASFKSPAGTAHDIDYRAEAGPTVELRVQALFGLDTHPLVGIDRIPLVLSLTSPAGRPIQTTRNLPEFWRGSWRDVAKEMRGRYPKHNWPDAPWESVASLKTKKAQARETPRNA
ncbi:ATP-dependent helicase HrpB [Sphingorhabdus wooponensis]|uniref:ATP-dependent helicase HrpB n=1 Tax=Sphingorhabdus wooponensis TaxID=940136 RepID=A0A3R8R7Q5_9SPHN|nr:ATP-dependent helicase HrpB [Sphingorhabdus wooponensis]RRQ51849.1 ATP-dependent helicase HrpB [Sphingorhabdus wooponensis]